LCFVFIPKELLKEKLEKRYELAKFIVELLYEKSNLNVSEEEGGKKKCWLSFLFMN
jgi:ATP-dependent DNA helicase RecQ